MTCTHIRYYYRRSLVDNRSEANDRVVDDSLVNKAAVSDNRLCDLGVEDFGRRQETGLGINWRCPIKE